MSGNTPEPKNVVAICKQRCSVCHDPCKKKLPYSITDINIIPEGEILK